MNEIVEATRITAKKCISSVECETRKSMCAIKKFLHFFTFQFNIHQATSFVFHNVERKATKNKWNENHTKRTYEWPPKLPQLCEYT